MIERDDITGLILAGGRGRRMGGIDKGLQAHRGVPLALHALLRLAPQVGHVMINANRNLAAYESMGVPVWTDDLPDFAGPLAGFLTGLERCETPYLATVPCDSPLFPQDLVAAPGRRARGRECRAGDGLHAGEQRALGSAGVLPDEGDAARKPGALHARGRAQDRSLDRRSMPA